jgi:DNA-binding NarL/FixJ family response regulator
MQVVLLSTDLMVVSRVQGAAAQASISVRTAGSVSQAVELLRELPADLLIVDLSLPALAIDALMEEVRTSRSSAVRIVAFGPHVHADRLEAARAAGCNGVMSRGQFFAQVDALLRGK